MTGRWYITRHAVECYMRVRRWPDDDAHFGRAEDDLVELAQTAKHRQTDGQGRQLWRTGRPLQLRWVVSTDRRPEGDLPQVVWVGQGSPARTHWDADTAQVVT